MSRKRRRIYRTPSKKELVKIEHTGYALNELFTDDEVSDFIAIARRRVIGEFYFATESFRGQRRGTDNYIIGVGGGLSDLATHVADSTHRPVISPSQLPGDIQELRPVYIEMVINRATLKVLNLALQLMRYQEVWYDEARGIWQVCQSSMDAYLEERRAARSSLELKFDRRNYHGRVRAQSKARGVPPGTSISVA